MKPLPRQSLALLGGIVATAGCDLATAEDAHSLRISADAPTVTVAPRNRRSNQLRLPALEYVFEVSARCAEPFDAGAVSLTVADSRRSVDAEELERNDAVRLTIPAAQLAPVPVNDFCIEPDDSGEDGAAHDGGRSETLTLPSALSASASLLCVSETERRMTYASTGLDVKLVCETGTDAGE